MTIQVCPLCKGCGLHPHDRDLEDVQQMQYCSIRRFRRVAIAPQEFLPSLPRLVIRGQLGAFLTTVPPRRKKQNRRGRPHEERNVPLGKPKSTTVPPWSGPYAARETTDFIPLRILMKSRTSDEGDPMEWPLRRSEQ